MCTPVQCGRSRRCERGSVSACLTPGAHQRSLVHRLPCSCPSSLPVVCLLSPACLSLCVCHLSVTCHCSVSHLPFVHLLPQTLVVTGVWACPGAGAGDPVAWPGQWEARSFTDTFVRNCVYFTGFLGWLISSLPLSCCCGRTQLHGVWLWGGLRAHFCHLPLQPVRQALGLPWVQVPPPSLSEGRGDPIRQGSRLGASLPASPRPPSPRVPSASVGASVSPPGLAREQLGQLFCSDLLWAAGSRAEGSGLWGDMGGAVG